MSYIHHCGVFGDSSKNLLSMIKSFPVNSVYSHLLTPKRGVAEFFENVDISTIKTVGISQFDNSQIGYYRRYRWLNLLTPRAEYHGHARGSLVRPAGMTTWQ
ncbi:MAG: hypothetical protein KAW56_00095 [Candidatus Marinimicrobia bacterium]|nr:hypothetical protein [Candidatus Neomarinimicrobiota bacterium]